MAESLFNRIDFHHSIIIYFHLIYFFLRKKWYLAIVDGFTESSICTMEGTRVLSLKQLRRQHDSFCEPESHTTCQAKVSHKEEFPQISKLEIIYQANILLDQLCGKA